MKSNIILHYTKNKFWLQNVVSRAKNAKRFPKIFVLIVPDIV